MCVGQDLGGVHALEESVEGHREGWGWVGALKARGFHFRSVLLRQQLGVA